mgnify:CR=1 FL=1
MNQHDTPAKVASTDGLGPLVADALTAADEYAEAAGHAECWTGTRASYNQHLADARTKARQAIDAAVAAERGRWEALLEDRAQIHGESSRIYARLASAVRAGAGDIVLGQLLRAEVQGRGPNEKLSGCEAVRSNDS